MAMAQRLASEGRKTLLVELGDHSYYSLAYSFSAQYDPQPLAPHLYHSLWSGESCLREYIRHLIPLRAVADLFFDNRVMRSFVRAAPGLKELAILGKLTSGVRQWGPPLPFENIVLDAYATGHFLALLRAPKGMGELIQRGPMGTESRRIVEVLNDPQSTQYCVVSLPESMPATESVELAHDIQTTVGLTPKMICNRFFGFNSELNQELNQRPELPLQTSFVGHLKELNVMQSQSLEVLNQVGVVHKLPFVLRNDVRTIVDDLRPHVNCEWVSP
jgi:anion-transporting  ArsA/GET3 family ATPase